MKLFLCYIFVIVTFLFWGCSSERKEFSAEDIWELTSTSLLRIEAEDLYGNISQGTGFKCNLNGQDVVITNRHVVAGAKKVRVGETKDQLKISNGYKISYKLDLALIDIPTGVNVPAIEIRKKGIQVGEKVYVIGFPLGLPKSITMGIVSSEHDNLLQFDASISSGNSGGPLIDKYGEAIGIVTIGSTGNGSEVAQNVNFAIKCDVIPELELFDDPVSSFYDSWVQFIETENYLINNLRKLKAFEVHDYLVSHFLIGFLEVSPIFKNDPEIEVDEFNLRIKEIKSKNDEILSGILDEFESIDDVVRELIDFYDLAIAKIDELPQNFKFIIDTRLREEFLDREMISSRVVGMDIGNNDFVPLLSTSLKFCKSNYREAKFILELLYRKKTEFDSGAIGFEDFVNNIYSDRCFENERERRDLDFSALVAEGKMSEVEAYCLASREYPSRDSLGSVNFKDPYDWIPKVGGMESHISEMFSRIAIRRFTEHDAGSALIAMEEEVNRKVFPSYRIRGLSFACLGDYQSAWDDHLRALRQSLEVIDPWNLKIGASNRMIYREFMLDVEYEMESKLVQRNIEGFSKWFKAKPFYERAIANQGLIPFDYNDYNDLELFCLIHKKRNSALSMEFEDYKSKYEKVVKRMMGIKKYDEVFRFIKSEPKSLFDSSLLNTMSVP